MLHSSKVMNRGRRPAGLVIRNAKSGFTLAEMIAAIALLAIFSVVVVQLFAASHTLAVRTDRLDGAVLCARNLAECWQASASQSDTDGIRATMHAAVGLDVVEALEPGQTARLFYDDEMTVVKEASATYLADVLLVREPDKGAEMLQIKVLDTTGRVLFELAAGRLLPPEVAP